ncbi:MAG: two-component system sensor histidine kinase NtrB, partial [Candidatus Entotheonellia bacterium]
ISSGRDRLAGLFVAGLSPCRALDDNYRGFLELVAGQVSTAVTNARAYEEERKRAEALAEVERRRAEEKLRESEARYRQMFENNRAVKLLIDPNSGAIVDANPAAAEFYGYSLDVLRAMRITDLNTLPPAQVAVEMGRAASMRRLTFVFRHRLASGEIRDVEVHSSPLNLQGRTLLYSIIHDITEHKQLEERLRQVQKMEALGQMAGNVAHDFNHLLMLIAGYSEVLLESLEADDPRRRDADEIQKAVDQATQLTQQLLAFGRRQTDISDMVDLNATIAQLEPLLQRLMGEQVVLSTRLAPALGHVKVERGQLEQIILNLALNARDAMPKGGELTLETVNFELGARDVRQHAGFPPGHYVRLVVRDTGCGMDAETQSRLFEPFFTTKEPGKGTGLGLSIVYAIITQGGGRIDVESAPGQGATFLIDLPRIDVPTSTASLSV